MEHRDNNYGGPDKHEIENDRDQIPDYEEDDNMGCGCLPILYGFLLAIATAGILYAAPYLKSSQPQTATPSKLEQKLNPKSSSKTLAEKCQTEEAQH